MQKSKFCLLVCIALCLSCLVGCGNQSGVDPEPVMPPPDDDVEITTLTMFIPFAVPLGETEAILARREQGINALLEKSGIPARLRLVIDNARGFDFSKINYLDYDIVLTTNDEYRVRAVSGEFADFSATLDARPDLWAINNRMVWESLRVYGQIRGIAMTRPYDEADCAHHSGMYIRTDILDALGLPVPTTVDELIDASLAARDAGFDYQIAYGYADPPYALHRTYPQWPFYVDSDSLLICDDKGNVSAYPGSEVYRMDSRILSEMHKRGILRVHSDEMALDLQKNWDALALFCPGPAPTQAPYTVLQFEPDRANFNFNYAYAYVLGITASCATPGLALDVLQFIYTNRDAYDAFVYGEKDTDYTLDADGYITFISKSQFWQMYQHNALSRSRAGETQRPDFFYVNEKTLIQLPGRLFTSVDNILKVQLQAARRTKT